jgi:hypothetical protein
MWQQSGMMLCQGETNGRHEIWQEKPFAGIPEALIGDPRQDIVQFT